MKEIAFFLAIFQGFGAFVWLFEKAFPLSVLPFRKCECGVAKFFKSPVVDQSLEW
jgi:hypothetical protein